MSWMLGDLIDDTLRAVRKAGYDDLRMERRVDDDAEWRVQCFSVARFKVEDHKASRRKLKPTDRPSVVTVQDEFLARALTRLMEMLDGYR